MGIKLLCQMYVYVSVYFVIRGKTKEKSSRENVSRNPRPNQKNFVFDQSWLIDGIRGHAKMATYRKDTSCCCCCVVCMTAVAEWLWRWIPDREIQRSISEKDHLCVFYWFLLEQENLLKVLHFTKTKIRTWPLCSAEFVQKRNCNTLTNERM